MIENQSHNINEIASYKESKANKSLRKAFKLSESGQNKRPNSHFTKSTRTNDSVKGLVSHKNKTNHRSFKQLDNKRARENKQNKEIVINKNKKETFKKIKRFKKEGDSLFLDSQFKEALASYRMAFSYLYYEKTEGSNKFVSSSMYLTLASNIAQCLMKLDKDDEASTYYQQILKIEPSNVKAHYNLANYHCKRKEYEKSYELLQKGLAFLNSSENVQLLRLYVDSYYLVQSLKDKEYSLLRSRLSHSQENSEIGRINVFRGKAPVLISLGGSLLTTGSFLFLNNLDRDCLLAGIPVNFLLFYGFYQSRSYKSKIIVVLSFIGVNYLLFKHF